MRHPQLRREPIRTILQACAPPIKSGGQALAHNAENCGESATTGRSPRQPQANCHINITTRSTAGKNSRQAAAKTRQHDLETVSATVPAPLFSLRGPLALYSFPNGGIDRPSEERVHVPNTFNDRRLYLPDGILSFASCRTNVFQRRRPDSAKELSDLPPSR
jgi:hypothetical protein